MIRVYPVNEAGDGYLDPIEYPDDATYFFDPAQIEPPGGEQFLVVQYLHAEERYSLWANRIEVVPPEPEEPAEVGGEQDGQG